MDDTSLLRYSRQILLPEIGIDGQQRLLDSRVLIIGLGGLGSPVALYLAAAGIGKLCLVDGDQVDLSNLQRQVVHGTGNIGQSKTSSAKERLLDINPECQIEIHETELEETRLNAEIAASDLVIDCSDNFSTRFLLNRLCHINRTSLVSGAAIRWEGQISVFNYAADEACYQCLYGEGSDITETCSENGVVAPLVGIIGSMQALEAIKLLSRTGETLSGRLLVFDALYQQWRTLKLKQDPDCAICSNAS